jgi:uncharacterized protein YkvS
MKGKYKKKRVGGRSMNLQKARAHDQILFNRFNETLEGTVMKRYENSVVVKLTLESYNKVLEDLPNDLTVVNDKNYQIIYQASENKELA